MLQRLLVANRGEIAIRVLRTAGDLGIETVAIAPTDDGATRHMRAATTPATIPGVGAAAYLDSAAVVAAAVLPSAGTAVTETSGQPSSPESRTPS